MDGWMDGSPRMQEKLARPVRQLRLQNGTVRLFSRLIRAAGSKCEMGPPAELRVTNTVMQIGGGAAITGL